VTPVKNFFTQPNFLGHGYHATVLGKRVRIDSLSEGDMNDILEEESYELDARGRLRFDQNKRSNS
jgi:hypothetical protein